MGNRQNEWAKHGGSKANLMKNMFGNSCYVRGCENKPKELAHIRQTPLSRTGPRDRKSIHADVMAHPKSYVATCLDHKNNPRTLVYQHDRRMAKLGRR